MDHGYRKLIACICMSIAAVALLSPDVLGQQRDPYDAPTLSCESVAANTIKLKICGGASTGAPAGVTVQWKKKSDWEANGWADDGTLCKLSLSGQPTFTGNSDSRWSLIGDNLCQSAEIGANIFDETGASAHPEGCTLDLECDTEYVFRSFAHASRFAKRSDWSEDLFCRTGPCDDACTRTQGYWKTHFDQWPASCFPMTLGTNTYSASAALSILNKPAQGNGLISMTHQLIAAKLNACSGTSDACIASAISAADALIGGQVVPPVGSGFLHPSSTSGLNTTLDTYNQGLLECAKHCANSRTGRGEVQSSGPSRAASWGEVKAFYR